MLQPLATCSYLDLFKAASQHEAVWCTGRVLELIVIELIIIKPSLEEASKIRVLGVRVWGFRLWIGWVWPTPCEGKKRAPFDTSFYVSRWGGPMWVHGRPEWEIQRTDQKSSEQWTMQMQKVMLQVGDLVHGTQSLLDFLGADKSSPRHSVMGDTKHGKESYREWSWR